MKTKLLTFLIIALSLLISHGCKKDVNAKYTPGEFITLEADNTGKAIGPDITYKGLCMPTDSYDCAGMKDVSIVHNNGSNSVTIYNMPSESSGTFTPADLYSDYYRINGSCKLYMIIHIGDVYYGSYSGRITKKTAKTFEFAIKMKTNDGKYIRDISGSGKY